MYKNKVLNTVVNTGYFLSRLPMTIVNPLRMTPQFIIIGTQKGGTTSLHAYLGMHPQIVLPKKKELHFFSKYYQNGMSWYRTFFPLKQANIITGEATPNYLFYEAVPTRIQKHLNDTKFIVVLRDPIERAISHYHMEKDRGKDDHANFEEALANELAKIKSGKQSNWESHYNSYLTRGKYYQQIKRWLSIFKREQFLFLNSQNLFANPQNTAQEVFSFLGLESFHLKNLSPKNVGNYKYQMSSDLETELKKFYKEEYTLLEGLIDTQMQWNR